jgi:hypothetical protein
VNRLVADSLEADWNAKLRLLDQARDEYQRLRAADRLIVDDEQRLHDRRRARQGPVCADVNSTYGR